MMKILKSLLVAGLTGGIFCGFLTYNSKNIIEYMKTNYRSVTPRALYMEQSKIEDANKWDKFHQENPNESVYQMDTVNLNHSKEEVKTRLENFLKDAEPKKFQEKWQKQLNEPNVLQRLFNIYHIWQEVAIDKKFEVAPVKNLDSKFDFERILSDLKRGKLIGDCKTITSFLILNYDTFTTEKELRTNNITYSFLMSSGVNQKITHPIFIKKKDDLNHLELIVHTPDADYLMDPTQNLQALHPEPVEYNMKLIDENIEMFKWENMKIVALDLRPNEKDVHGYHRYQQVGVPFQINYKSVYGMMQGSFIYGNKSLR